MNRSSLRRALAELLGTALLAFVGPGTVVAAVPLGQGQHTLGTTSGAYISPAVSVALATVPWGELWIYLSGPVMGAVLAAFVCDPLVTARSGLRGRRAWGHGSD
jgi:glycerol uptake facilitator-like aquaporin